MIYCTQSIKRIETLFMDPKPLIDFQNPFIQKVYQVAMMAFRVGVFAVFTYLTPMGSFATSLGCYAVCLYYKLIQEAKIKNLKQSQERSKEMIDRAFAPDESVQYFNRLQQEFEIVNIVTLTVFQHLSLPISLILGGMFVWNRFEDRQTETKHAQERDLMLAELDSRSQGSDN